MAKDKPSKIPHFNDFRACVPVAVQYTLLQTCYQEPAWLLRKGLSSNKHMEPHGQTDGFLRSG
jgi:hypothetical protein